MNHYVFNTALTRAKYLVVAVGNPLQLLDKEERMCNKNPAKKHFRCWKEYIKRCTECKSLQLPKGVNENNVKEFRKVLYGRIFSQSKADTSDDTIYGSRMPMDSILSAYKKKFESIPACRNSKLRLTRVDGTLSWHMKDSQDHAEQERKVDDTEEESDDTYHYRLQMRSFSNADAIPLDTSKRVVQIRGMGNIKGAFHDDIVEVVTFKEVPKPLCKGKVVRVIRKCHKEMVVCKAHKYNPILFCPIDKKYPIISNLPKLSKHLRDKGGIVAELKSKDVVIFEPGSLTEGSIPEIKNVIPFSIAQEMLFVVRIVHWNPKFRLPLGVVIHALPKGSSEFHAERIIRIEHNVHYDDETEQPLPDSAKRAPIDSETTALIDTRAFTIDPEDAVNLDDAISLSKEQDSYHLAVYIVNTTKEIGFDTQIDKKARTRGVSMYGGKKVMNMLPAQMRYKLSLNPHQICDVISISGNVDFNEGDIDIKDIEVKESKIRSCAKLSYESAQKIMDGTVTELNPKVSQYIAEYDSNDNQPNLNETLLLLLKIAMQLRVKRLGDLGALSYETNKESEQQCWQTHLMVEELMIWANNVIAHGLLSAYPECALLRRQSMPNAEELAAISSAHTHVLRYSYRLSQYKKVSASHKPLVIPMSTLDTLLQCVEAGDTNLLCNLLTDASLFPQLSAVSSSFRRIQQKAEYISATADADPEDYQHHSLNLAEYTHFTSPLRRYTDIVVQRMVKSFISKDACLYNHDDIVSLCHSLNGALRNSKSFEKQMNTLMLAVEYMQSSKLYEAVVVRNTIENIELSFLNKELKDIPAKDKQFKVRLLRSRKPAVMESANKVVYSWTIKMLSFDHESSFPYNYEGLSFPSTESTTPQDSTSPLNEPYILMKMFTEVETGMLKSIVQSVEASQTATTLSPGNWKDIVTFLKDPSEETFRVVKSSLEASVPRMKSTTISSQSQIKSPIVICDVDCRLDVYDIVKVWMTWSTRQAILSPQLQLLEITPFFRICLQHNAHPAECFSDSHLTNASKECYTDLKEYVHLWEKVLLAEAAERSVNDNRSGILFDVKLNWGKLAIPETIDALHYEPKGSIRLNLPSTINEARPFLKVHVGDLMCVRYGTKKTSSIRAVFHLVVTNYESKENENTVMTLKHVSADNVLISEKMKEAVENEKCEIQVISMSPSYQ